MFHDQYIGFRINEEWAASMVKATALNPEIDSTSHAYRIAVREFLVKRGLFPKEIEVRARQ